MTEKHILILGGTGSLGQALVKNMILKYPHVKITIASRNEHKHSALMKQNPSIKYALCDIRDKSSILPIMKNQDIVFHVAALKSVDYLEDNVLECIKTNVQGTINVAEACIESGVRNCLFSSTDKAVMPINTYGYCKALSEKILFDFNNRQMHTKFVLFRWANVLASQGSAIPFFIDCLKRGERVPVTDERMTRFWISLDEAARFMIDNYNNHEQGVLIPPTLKAAPIMMVINVLADLLDVEPAHRVVGIRKGEKLHESMGPDLVSDTAPWYSFTEMKDLLRPVVEAHK